MPLTFGALKLHKKMSNKITAAITAVGGFVPEDKLTNADLEKWLTPVVDSNKNGYRGSGGF